MKIKVTDLKKHLKQYNQTELVNLVVEIFKVNKEVQNYLSSKLIGEEATEILFQEAQKNIKNEFYPDRGQGKLRLAEAKKVITSFKKITNDEKRTVDLMLFFVELAVEYTSEYGYISDSYYTNILKMFDRVALECDQDENLYNVLAKRIDRVLSLSKDTVWGFEEAVVEIYYSINWVHEEEDDDA
ncbi:DUF6155 family protein [Pseudoneobacillus sp. C159]